MRRRIWLAAGRRIRGPPALLHPSDDGVGDLQDIAGRLGYLSPGNTGPISCHREPALRLPYGSNAAAVDRPNVSANSPVLAR